MGQPAITSHKAPGALLRDRVAVVAIEDDPTARAIEARLRRDDALVERITPPDLERAADAARFSNAVDAIVRSHGRLNIWVQSAATDLVGRASEIGIEEWRRGMDQTAGAAFAGAHAAGRHMLVSDAGDRSIIFLTSVDGLLASATRAAP